MNKKLVHNLVWIPIFLFGLIIILLGLYWGSDNRSMIVKKMQNEILSENSSYVFEGIGEIDSYSLVTYKFFGLSTVFAGMLIVTYLYVTRLGTGIARNALYIVLSTILVAAYYLVFTHDLEEPFLPLICVLSIFVFFSFYFSNQLGD